jgi:capsular exopolysaccharide synthesis family protein
VNELTRHSRRVPEVGERSSRTPVLRSSLTPDEAEGREGIPMREYLEALRRYLWLVLAAVGLSVGFAGYRLSQELPMYMASTAIRLVDPRVAMSGDLEAGEPGQLPGWYTDPILSQIQLLKSRNVAGAVVDSLGLRVRPSRPNFPQGTIAAMSVNSAAKTGDSVRVEFGEGEVRARMKDGETRAAYGRPLELAGVRITFTGKPAGVEAETFTIVSRDDAVNGVLNGLQARPRDMTNVIDIAYLAYDPHLAQRVADLTAASFQRLSAESAQQESRRRRLFIQEQLRSTDSLLMRAQYELSAFRKGVQAFSPREKFRSTQESLGELRLRRDELERERRIYEQMHNELRADRGREGSEQIAALAASPEVATNGGVVSLYQQLIRYQTIRDSVTTGAWAQASTNPDVERVDSLIETSKSRLVRAVGARSTALAAQMGVLDEVIASDADNIRALPDAEAEEQRLGRQVETLQTLVDDLLREQQKARIDEAVEAGQVQLVDGALLPGGPMGRGGKKRMLFALLVGLMIGGGGALVLDRMNTALLRREEVESLLHVPALGVIPRVSASGSLTPRRLRVPGMALMRRTPAPTDGLITATDLHSAGSQAYRKLRTHLIFSTAGEPMRTLLVTSPAASEGKSTVCANLAVTFAQQNLRVLLVDGDLRRSRLHHVFETERTPGLGEVLSGAATIDEAVRPTAVPGLSLLPAGVLAPNASELLGSAMRPLLDALAERFDLVILDTPPILAAADAEIMGVQSDAVLLVVRAGQTDRSSAQYAVQQMRAIGARVVGAVLNDPDEKVPGYGRYAYYYDYTATNEKSA